MRQGAAPPARSHRARRRPARGAAFRTARGPQLARQLKRQRDAAHSINVRGQLLCTERWAFLSWQDGAEFYDMDEDPRQLTSLADDPDHAEVRAAMMQRLR